MWVGYIPEWAVALAPMSAISMLHFFGVIEIILGVWILIGRTVRIPAYIAGGILLFITVTNPTQFVILFRDISLALAAFALAIYPPRMPSNDRAES